MVILRDDRIDLHSVESIIKARQIVRDCAIMQGFSLVDQTKLVTAASELARNTLIHGGGGEMHIEVIIDGARRGVRATFVDHGPGIPDIDQAMRDGYTSKGGLGLGLGGAKRLVNKFAVTSTVGEGTTVTIERWR
jgi:serine/threonine-protein kinase RsbT